MIRYTSEMKLKFINFFEIFRKLQKDSDYFLYFLFPTIYDIVIIMYHSIHYNSNPYLTVMN